MRILLDTHVIIAQLSDALPDRIKSILGNATETYLSHVSLWEIEIKKSLGKLFVPDDFYVRLEKSEAVFLPISVGHIQQVGKLPFHHRDPFDRMLVAQAQMEGLKLLTDDRQLSAYDAVLL